MRPMIPTLALAAVVSAQTPRSAMGWGDEISPADAPSRAMGDAGEALRSDRSWDPRLEARSAFGSLAALEVQVSPQNTTVSGDGTSGSGSEGRLPRLSLSVPMGRFGHLGLGYWQRFDRSFDWQSPTDSSTQIQGQGGAFEGDLAYGLQVPGLRGAAAGVTYHRILGTDRIMQVESFQAADEGVATSYADTIGVRYWGSYWTGSVYYTHGPFDAGAWLDFAGDVRRTTTLGGTRQQFEQPAPNTVDPPRSAGFAAAWRVLPRQSVVGDLSWTDWSGAVPGSPDRWKGGLGWQLGAAGDRYDDFWRRLSWRAGAYGIVGGPDNLLTEAVTAGVGMPMGNLGTLDLSLQVGQNEVDNGGPALKDSFVRLYVGITGANAWGRSTRSRR
jgi:hypothetical protein